MGALYHVRDFLGPRGSIVAYKSFVRPVCEYGSVTLMGLQPPIYLNLTLYRRWLRDFVDMNSLHCILFVKRVQWGCSVNCLTVGGEEHCSIFIQLLPPHRHIPILLKKFIELWSPVIIFTSLVYISGFILKKLLQYNCQHLGIYTPSSIRLRDYEEGWAVIRKLLQTHNYLCLVICCMLLSCYYKKKAFFSILYHRLGLFVLDQCCQVNVKNS